MNLYWIVAREEYNHVEDIEHGLVEYNHELAKRGVAFSFITLEDCVVACLPDTGLRLTYKGRILEESTSAFIISSANLNAQARAVSLTLRNYFRVSGACLLNEAIFGIETVEWDKIAQLSLAMRVGAPVLPFTMLGYHRHVISSIEGFAAHYPGEYIFKPTGSGMGFGVIKSDSLQHAISTGNLISASSIEYFMMLFLTEACDVRFFFIAQELAFVEFRKPRGEGYIGNVAVGGEQLTLTVQEFCKEYDRQPFFRDMMAFSRRIMEKTACTILSVDWLVNEGGFYFNEMATAETGLSYLPQKVRSHVFDHLVGIINEK